MTNYDGISENMGIHGPMLHNFKMMAVKNAKKLELGFSVNHIPYSTDSKYTTNCFECDKYW